MTYYSSQRGAGLLNTLAALREQRPFESNGALSADTTTKGAPLPWGSKLPEEHRGVYYSEEPTYVVYSYGTPIGWWSELYGWTEPDVKYSRTTSRHQSVLHRAVHSQF